MKFIFQLLSHWPLALLHGLGALLGLSVLAASAIYRRRLIANAQQSALAPVQGWWGCVQSAMQAGMMVAELPRLWMGSAVRILWRDPAGLDAVFARAAQQNKGLIFLTPHLGSWEVAGQAIASACNAHNKIMTVMYKPAKQAALDAIVQASRKRPGMQTVPADLSGVRQTLKALQQGQAIGLLPDQVPQDGMGVWAQMFAKPAYTMSLAAKLAQTQRCIVVMVWCERLLFGRGYCVDTQRLDLAIDESIEVIVQQINRAVESAISKKPTQYLWGYARYKSPKKI